MHPCTHSLPLLLFSSTVLWLSVVGRLRINHQLVHLYPFLRLSVILSQYIVPNTSFSGLVNTVIQTSKDNMQTIDNKFAQTI